MENLKRHNEALTILNNISDKSNDSKRLILKPHLIEEKCLGIFSTANPRDDNLPTIFLHSEECWNVCGHSCPQTRKLPPDELYLPNDDGVLADLDYYVPTLHTNMAMLVMGDLTVVGCYPDWDSIDRIVKKYTKMAER